MSFFERRRLLVFLLRLGGVATIAAFPTMLLPADWMAATHRWLGLGEFPQTAIVDYLARSVAALYGFHGVLLLIVARDPIRFAPIVTFAGVMNIALGLMMMAIDAHAGLPWWWTLGEGPPTMGFGIVILLLSRPDRPA